MVTMALEVYWYDSVCFGIVGSAFFGALWVLWRKEGSRTDDNTIYESLLVSRPDSDVFALYESLLVSRPDSDVFVSALPRVM